MAMTIEQQRAVALARARRRRAEAVPSPAPAAAPVKRTGLIENIGAGIDEGANMVLGAPVDLPVWIGNKAVDLANAGMGAVGAEARLPNIPVDLPGSRIGWERTQEKLGFTPPTAVEPADEGQRLARAGAEALTAAIIPEVGMLKAGQVVAQAGKTAAPAVASAVDTLGSVLGNSRTAGEMATSAAVNAAAGVGSQAAMDVAPENLKPVAGIIGGMVGGGAGVAGASAPRLARAGIEVAKDAAAPLSQSGREVMAGRTLREGAADAGAVIDAIETAPPPLVAGSRPTTFQQTGDMGLGALERGVAARNPAEFQQRRAEQNEARVDTLGAVQPGGAPEQVVSAVRGMLKSIDDETQAVLDAATQRGRERIAGAEGSARSAVAEADMRAQEAARGLGQGRTPDLVGEDLRASLETARAAAKTRERALWKAVDPDGSLALPVANTKQSVRGILTDITPVSAKPEGVEASIYSDIAKLGEGAMPFRYVTELDSRIKTAMREERLARGDSTAYLRLSRLKSAVESDLDSAISGKVADEREAVQAGVMSPEQTTEAAILRAIEEWRGRQASESGQNLVGLSGNAGSSRTSSVPPAPRNEVQNGGGFRATPSDPRLSPDVEPNFDAEALGRLKDARAATRSRAETFDNSTLAPIRKRPMATGQYEMLPSAVPGKIFFPGPKSADAISTYRRAVGEQQAMATLTDYVVDRLRKTAMREDGTLDPARVAAFQRNHADALRSFPQLNARFGVAADASARVPTTEAASSDAVKNAIRNADDAIAEAAVNRKMALDEAQKGAVGRLVGLEDPSDITRTIGALFARKDAVLEFKRLQKAIGENVEAKQGLRKAVVDHITGRFVSNTEAGTSNQNLLKSDAFQTFVKGNKPALKAAGFADNEIETLERIAADLRQANRSITAVKIPGGSNTAQDAIAAKIGDTPATMLSKILAQGAGSGITTTLFVGPWIGLPVGVATSLVSALRQAGLSKVDDLVRDAMLNPQRARVLMLKATPQQAEKIGLSLAQLYRRAAVFSATQSQQNQEPSLSGR